MSHLSIRKNKHKSIGNVIPTIIGKVLAIKRFVFCFRDNMFFGITRFIPNSGQTWQAGHLRPYLLRCACMLGIPKPRFHTSCGYAFLRNAELLLSHTPETQKEPGARHHLEWHLTPGNSFSFHGQENPAAHLFWSFSKKFFLRFNRCSPYSMRVPDALRTNLYSKTYAVCFFRFSKDSAIIAATSGKEICRYQLMHLFWFLTFLFFLRLRII